MKYNSQKMSIVVSRELEQSFHYCIMLYINDEKAHMWEGL